jgi:hypothetical protein
MKHPHSRSERRYARVVWRDRRRKICVTTWYTGSYGVQCDPTENNWWLHSGKQCSAHGNRCACNDRIGRHREVKRARREKIEFEMGRNAD